MSLHVEGDKLLIGRGTEGKDDENQEQRDGSDAVSAVCEHGGLSLFTLGYASAGENAIGIAQLEMRTYLQRMRWLASIFILFGLTSCDLQQHPTREELIHQNAELQSQVEELQQQVEDAKQQLAEAKSAVESAEMNLGDRQLDDAESDLEEAGQKIDEADSTLNH